MLQVRDSKEEIILKEDMAGTPLIFGYSEFTSLIEVMCATTIILIGIS